MVEKLSRRTAIVSEISFIVRVLGVPTLQFFGLYSLLWSGIFGNLLI
jgi:hypothetical protein